MQSKQYAEQYFEKNYRKLNIDRSRLLPTEEALKSYGFYRIIAASNVRSETEIVLQFNDFMIWCKEQGITTVFTTECRMNKSKYIIDQDLIDGYIKNSPYNEEMIYAVSDVWNSQLSSISSNEFCSCGVINLFAIDARGIVFSTGVFYNPIHELFGFDTSVNDAGDVLYTLLDNMFDVNEVDNIE